MELIRMTQWQTPPRSELQGAGGQGEIPSGPHTQRSLEMASGHSQ